MTLAPRRFAWVLNLDAEFELEKASYNAPARLTEQLRQYGAASRLLLGPGDVLLEEGVADPSQYVGRAWSPTPRAVAALRAAGVEPEPHPPLEVLKRVNHRRFAVELGGGLPEQRYIERRADFDALPLHASRPWLLKRALAFAGRGQMRVYAELDEKQSSWIDASLRVSGLVIEPLVVPTLELSQHGFIWRDSHFEIGRCCVQEVTLRGVFRGVRLATESEVSADERGVLERKAREVAAALAAAGYFGPFGIDAYRYTWRGETGFCALGEINARYSMGFVTGFPRHPSELHLEETR